MKRYFVQTWKFAITNTDIIKPRTNFELNEEYWIATLLGNGIVINMIELWLNGFLLWLIHKNIYYVSLNLSQEYYSNFILKVIPYIKKCETLLLKYCVIAVEIKKFSEVFYNKIQKKCGQIIITMLKIK